MSKLSQVVVSHAESLIEDLDTTQCPMRVYPKSTLTDAETKLFWRYHGRFPQEFTQALINKMPKDLTFVSYDHLQNQLNVTGAH